MMPPGFVAALVADGWAAAPAGTLCHAARLAAPEWLRFFDSDRKFRGLARPGELAGYFPLRAERAVGSAMADQKEFFHIYDPSSLEANLREVTTPVFDLACELSRNIAADLLRLGHLPFPVTYDGVGDHLLRVIRYPPRATGPAAAAHTDITLFSLAIYQNCDALRLIQGGREIAVAPSEHVVLVLAGDMLEIASRGSIKAIRHLADPVEVDRLAIVFFANPPATTTIAPGTTAHDALQARLREMAQDA